jgi:hypothetical protein
VTCNVCNDNYQTVTFRFALDPRRVLSGSSVMNMCEFVSVIFGTLSCTGMAVIVYRQEKAEFERTMWAIIPMMVIMVVLSVMTLKKVYERWKRANSEKLARKCMCRAI